MARGHCCSGGGPRPPRSSGSERAVEPSLCLSPLEPRRGKEDGGGTGLSFTSGFSSCFLDTIFVSLLRAGVETAVSEVHKLLLTGGVPVSLAVLFCR